jgi:hypothetical protein
MTAFLSVEEAYVDFGREECVIACLSPVAFKWALPKMCRLTSARSWRSLQVRNVGLCAVEESPQLMRGPLGSAAESNAFGPASIELVSAPRLQSLLGTPWRCHGL